MDLSKQTMIGEILVARGRITRSQLSMAKKLQETACITGEMLVADELISSEDLDIALGWQLAETIVGLGYADEREVFGSLRISVVKRDIGSEAENQPFNRCKNEELDDLSNFY